ncbi:MAG: DUF481 domain-containing protein [Campylobacterota bacterium]|nr:DUF481 domain-containing protein [Campylobacterota bacterium]
MKLFLLLNLFILSLSATNLDTNTTQGIVPSEEQNTSVEIEPIESEDDNTTSKDSKRPKEDILIVKDNSGLSDDEIRKRAKTSDNKKVAKVSVSEVVKALDESGKVDISKLQERWEDLSPTPLNHDWVQTKSGEWFKGEIKALYDDKLEFDSDEVGLYTFDFDDVVRIKSYHIISVNIENLASFPGILRLKGEDLTIIQGENRYEFKRQDIVSFAPDGEYERNFWSGKATLSLDIRSGNTNQYDYSAKFNAQRRTSVSRLSFDYLGRITSKDNTETANDHRINQKYDRYLTRHFFWTPVFSEIYTDKYKNIDRQLTLGLGVGYTLIDTKKSTWSLSGGPAFLYTRYETVGADKSIDSFSPALELSTKYEIEINKITDITYSYKLTFTDSAAGKYKHHMLLTLENEITSWLDIDVTGVWDYILEPEIAADNSLPKRDDYQLLVGFGIEF